MRYLSYTIVFLNFIFFQICYAKIPAIALDVNPLLLANQGIGFNSEALLFNPVSLGIKLEYENQTPYNFNGVQAKRNQWNCAPMVRVYFLNENLSGPFVGFALNIIRSQSNIANSIMSVQNTTFAIAPTIHLGLRSVLYHNWTLSMYVGVGLKSKNTEFPSTKIPTPYSSDQDWENALSKLNERVTRAQPDYGLTFGTLF